MAAEEPELYGYGYIVEIESEIDRVCGSNSNGTEELFNVFLYLGFPRVSHCFSNNLLLKNVSESTR